MIELRNVSKIYGREKAVDSLSLKISRGIVFGFLGPNGAGKTTTIKMLVGISFQDEGEILIEGQKPSEKPLRFRIGFMPENPSFYDYLTGLEFLKFMYELSPLPKQIPSERESVFTGVLKKTGIYDARHKIIKNYSKGMRQRLAFAQALVHNPEYIFLDEPLDGLDPLGRREVKKIIQELNSSGKTIFFNSHILADVEEICNEIGIIHRGKLLYAGGVKEFCAGRSLEEQFVKLIEASSA